jgi:NAD+ synthase (glutamine-hydrolysing)
MSRVPSAVHVAAAALNQTVGDWSGNQRRIEQAIHAARARGAVLLALPELCIPGYSLGDRVWMQGTVERSWRMLAELAPQSLGMVVLVGLPVSHRGALYDVVAVLADGQVRALVPKENLATGDVQYETRWYSGWERGRVDTFVTPDGTHLPMGTLIFEAAGLGCFGVEVCEDGWKGVRPGSVAALAGAHLVINASASWFILGKHARRRALCADVSRQDRCAYVYTSLSGCDSTRLIFDGSVFVAVDGRIEVEAPRFRFRDEVVLVDTVIDLAAIERGRLAEGSWRFQVEAQQAGTYGTAPTLIELDLVVPEAAPPPAGPPYWERRAVASIDPSLDWVVAEGFLKGPLGEQDLAHLELELGLAMGLYEYLRKSGVPGVALALSGGRDSAMCALLVHRMLTYANPGLDAAAVRALMRGRLVTAYLATENSGEATETAARELAEELGAEHLVCRMQEAVDLHRRLVGEMVGEEITWEVPAHDVPLQNVQARLRGSLIWMVANLRGRLLLATSNLSEAAVGYTTMDGDTAGGLAPISNVPKSLVTAWLTWAARAHGYRSLRHVLDTPATAELRPSAEEQTDEGDLMPFAVLDRLMYHFAFLGEDPLVMFQRLWPEFSGRYGGDPRAFAAHIRKFVRLFCGAQWKRERFAIGLRVTAFDLDPKTGFRFPPVQAPFREELAELDAWVERLAVSKG